MRYTNRKLRFIVYAIVIIVLFFLVLYFPVQPSGKILTDGWTVGETDNPMPFDFPFYQTVEEMTIIAIEKNVDYSTGDALVLTWFRGQALRVYVDDQLVFSQGNIEMPTANIWNNTFLVQLPEPRDDRSVIEIQIASASYPFYLPIPPYIMPLEKAEIKVGLINFLYGDLLLLSMGASLSIGLILIIMSVTFKKGWSAEIFFGLTSILGAVECLDYVHRISTGNLQFYLAGKKILMISGYLGALVFVAGVEKYFRGEVKFSKILAVPTFLSTICIAQETNLARFSDLVNYLNILLLVDLVIAIVLITRGKKGKDWLILSAVWLIIGLLEMIVVQFFQLPWPFVMQYVLLISSVMFGMSLLVDFNKIYVEKRDLEERIDLDILTTAYNRNILDKAFPKQFNTLILMDLDNFKAYNDKYGHQKGDELLIAFAEIIKSNMRQNDKVVRYGGDEFLLLLCEIGIIDAERVAKRIQKQLEELAGEDNLSVSYGIEAIENSLYKDLNKADHLMYTMKQAKRKKKLTNEKKKEIHEND